MGTAAQAMMSDLAKRDSFLFHSPLKLPLLTLGNFGFCSDSAPFWFEHCKKDLIMYSPSLICSCSILNSDVLSATSVMALELGWSNLVGLPDVF